MHYQKNNIGHFLCGPKTYMVFFKSEKKVNYTAKEFPFPSRAQNIVVRGLSSETKGSLFGFGCQLFVEVSALC